jgi:pyridoxamine 5'-phosphate oxidase
MTQYTRNPPLRESDLHKDPRRQLERWLRAATSAGQIEPTAMTLATVDARGRPSARLVLFKGFYRGGPTFYTNYTSRKGVELKRNPRAALVFWWDRLERQVRIEGRVARVPRGLSSRYFHSRPRASQLGALTSRQSREVASRRLLDERMAANERQLAGRMVPLPDAWGGYVLLPEMYEFWQGRRGRLHDRLAYKKARRGWRVVRLEP